MMKTRILITVALATVLSLTGFANNKKKSAVNQKVDVQLTAENQIVVRYLSDSNDKVKVLVFDKEGNTLSRKVFENEGHSKITYDVNKLESKTLQFKVIANNKTVCFEEVSVDVNGLASIPLPHAKYQNMLEIQQPLLTEQDK